MQFTRQNIEGVFEITPNKLTDERGYFVKTFNDLLFKAEGFEGVSFKEEYFSRSTKGVLRGMHFQVPPHEHSKFVYCIHGEVQDVLLDLRKNSKTYGAAISIYLNDRDKNCLFIPKGIAHGFYTLSEEAIMVYKTSTVYNKASDAGVHWESCKDIWDLRENPLILSERDSNFSKLDCFDSPF